MFENLQAKNASGGTSAVVPSISYRFFWYTVPLCPLSGDTGDGNIAEYLNNL